MHRYAVLLFFVTSFSFAGDKAFHICITPDGRPDFERKSGEDCAKLPDWNNLNKAEEKSLHALMMKAEKRRKESWQKLSVGMTKSTVEKSWNEPNKQQIRRVQTRDGVTEEWRIIGHGKLTFKNDVLEAIED